MGNYEERTYLAWVLIYDQMVYLQDAPCDVGYEICLKVADMFLQSKDNVSSKPLYTAFWSWFENNLHEINHFVRYEIESNIKSDYKKENKKQED